METSAPIMHDAILLGVGIAAVYLVVAALQLLQLKGLRARPRRPDCEPSLGIIEAEENFAARLQESQAETQLLQLRSDVARLHAELQALRDEMRRRDARPAITRQTPETTSKYNGAMRYAQHGMSAAGIALKCGISLSEAELVVALSRDVSSGQAHGEEHGQRRAAA